MLHADHAQERIQWIYWSLMVLLAASMVSKVGAQAVFFRDVAAQAGIDFTYSQGDRSSLLVEDMGPGAAFVDYDNDGYLDVYLGKYYFANDFYANLGDGTFRQIRDLGLGDARDAKDVSWCDYDNDGDLDVFIADVDADLPSFCPSTGRRAHMYENTGNVSNLFVENTFPIHPSDLAARFDVATVDIYVDGWLDIFHCK